MSLRLLEARARRPLFFVAAALVLLCLPRSARAFDFTVRGERLRLDLTESMFLSAHLDNGNSDPTDDNYGELLNRLNAQLAWKRLLFSVRFDSGAWVLTPKPGRSAGTPGGSGNGYCTQVFDPVTQASLVAAQRATCTVQPNDPRLKDRFRAPGKTVKRSVVPFGVSAFYLEKISLDYTGRVVEATLGDFYANLGRGLVLSVRKLDELGTDSTITGGKVVVHTGGFTATALAGYTNVQNIDTSRAQWIDDPNDLVAAAQVGYRLFDRVLVAGQGMFGIPSRDSANPPGATNKKPFDYRLRPGLLVDAPRLTSWLGLYAEAAGSLDRLGGKDCTERRRTDASGKQRNDCGYAVYGAASVYLGRASLLLEAKRYDNYQPWHASNDPFGNLVYMAPPTLERVLVQLNNNTDITAGRLRLDVSAAPGLNVYASGELGRSHPTSQTTDTLVDLYGGAEVRWDQGRSHFFPTVEFRNEHQEAASTIGLGPLVEERLVALEWDAAQALPHGLSLEASGLVWFRKKPSERSDGTLDQNAWREGNVYFSLKWSPRLVVSLGYEFTTLAKEALSRHNFFNGSVLWNIRPGTSLGLFVGGNRPGLKCISGVCRDFPAFQGARLELVVRL